MKSILCFELKRCFGSKRLYLSLLTGIVISLLHIIFGVLPLTQWLSSWQGDFFLTPHSAYGHWIGMDSSTVWPTLLYADISGLLSVYGCQNRSVSGSTYMVYTHVLLYLHCSLISDSGRQRGRHSCSAAGKEQSLVVVQQMSCANRVESALLCSRLLLCMRILLFYKWFVLLYHFAV